MYTQSTEPIVYTNLKAGNYILKVIAANNDGVWNEEGASLEIIKKPAIWETGIFKVAMILFIAFAIFWGVKTYNRGLLQSWSG